jgi:hypothetical protein
MSFGVVAGEADDRELDGRVVAVKTPALPPVLAGTATPEVFAMLESFYNSIERIFESWVARSESLHTRRAYRDDIMAFVRFLNVEWPDNAEAVLQVSALDIQRFAEVLRKSDAAKQDVQPAHLLALLFVQVPEPIGRGA